MTIICVFDRELPQRLMSLLSVQRREPIHIRLVSQHFLDFKLDGLSIFTILKRLKTKKNANITLLIDKKRYIKNTSISIKQKIQQLVDIGINFHTINNLHAKIVTVENNQEKCLLITSANLSYRAYFKAHEAGLYLHNHDEEIFNKFKRYITHLIMIQNQ